jgi:hypothetical protein
MSRQTVDFSQQPHFHIRWTSSAKLDWERFSTQEEAEASATQLMRAGETYTVEKFDGSCPRCAESDRRYQTAS